MLLAPVAWLLVRWTSFSRNKSSADAFSGGRAFSSKARSLRRKRIQGYSSPFVRGIVRTARFCILIIPSVSPPLLSSVRAPPVLVADVGGADTAVAIDVLVPAVNAVAMRQLGQSETTKLRSPLISHRKETGRDILPPQHHAKDHRKPAREEARSDEYLCGGTLLNILL